LIDKAKFAIALKEKPDAGVFLQGIGRMDPEELACHPQVHSQVAPLVQLGQQIFSPSVPLGDRHSP
jgi:hypothetical protein